MEMIRFVLEDGSAVSEWDEIGDRKIDKIIVDVITLGLMPGKTPLLLMQKYDKYMFQKYSVTAMGGSNDTIPFAGLQVGGYKKDCGAWVIYDIDLSRKIMEIQMLPKITSNSIKDGMVGGM